MNGTLVRLTLVAAALAPLAAAADPESPRASAPPAVTRPAPPPHPNPRLKLAYRRYAIANLDGSTVWLDGAELDAFFLSRRWIRIGVELSGATGRAAIEGNGLRVGAGLAGVIAGFQYPARV